MSARVGDDRFLITPTGSCLGELEPHTFVCVDGQGNPLDIDDAPPSAEHRMHLAIYPVRLDVNAIIHAHPPHVVAITLAGRNLSDPLLPELLVNVGEVPTLPYTTPTSDDTATTAQLNARLIVRHAELEEQRQLQQDRLREGAVLTDEEVDRLRALGYVK